MRWQELVTDSPKQVLKNAPKRLVKKAEAKAKKDATGKGWTQEQFERRVLVLYRRAERDRGK